MTDDRMRGLDPRFDAVFQRGSGSSRADVVPDDGALRLAALAQRPDSAWSLSERSESKGAQRPGAPGFPSEERNDEAKDTLDDVLDEFTEIDPEPPASRRWELTILIVSLALIAAGLVLSWWWVHASFGGYSFSGPGIPVEFIIMQISNQIAGPMITIGIAALVGLLFLRAIRTRSAG
jgi:hypothetical protein